MAIYALNLFDLRDQQEYLTYSRQAHEGAAKHGARIVALGRFKTGPAGDIAPRQVMLLVEWPSQDALQGFLNDPAYSHIHTHREKGTEHYVFHLFEKFTELAPLLEA